MDSTWEELCARRSAGARWRLGLAALVVALQVLAAPAGAQPGASSESGEAGRPQVLEELIDLLGEEGVVAFLAGEDPSAIVLSDGTRLSEFLAAHPELAANLVLPWFTLEGGGRATGGGFRLQGVIGQWDSGTSVAGDLQLRSGFLAFLGPAAPTCVGPGGIFCDGFEAGDLSAWTTLIAGKSQIESEVNP